MLLFLDESGTDHRVMPYEVVGGIAIRERDLWNYVQAVEAAQEHCFGDRLAHLAPGKEFKASDLLARDKFRYAAQGPAIEGADRRQLAKTFLERGRRHEAPRAGEFTAYGQACLEYVARVLDVANHFGVKVFASVVEPSAPRSASDDALRRDLAFLFERYFCYLEELSPDERGLVVFDELEKSQCRGDRPPHEQLLSQDSEGGSSAVVESSRSRSLCTATLTTGTHTADLVVYVINWAFRCGPIVARTRPELDPFARQVFAMQYSGHRCDEEGYDWRLWGIKYVDDLRAAHERWSTKKGDRDGNSHQSLHP